MTPADYESLVHALTAQLVRGVTELSHSAVRGAKNREIGVSGFKHQIDVAIASANLLLLIECKHLNRRVDATAVLVLASRIADIQAVNPARLVAGCVASRREATSGAQVLARKFDIDLHVILSMNEYAFRIQSRYFLGLVDKARGSNIISVERHIAE